MTANEPATADVCPHCGLPPTVDATAVHVLELPDLPYFNPNRPKHHQQKATLNRAWKEQTRWLLRQHPWRTLRADRVHVRLTFHAGDRRRRDADNLIPGVQKPVVDALVAEGIIPDDNPAHLEWSRPLIVADGPRRWELTVTVLDASEAAA